MGSYTLAITLDRPYKETVQAVRRALEAQGFGVLTEIDLRATLKKKLGVDVAPQTILGACRPTGLPGDADGPVARNGASVQRCRSRDGHGTTVVEAFDPAAMIGLSGEGWPGLGGYGRAPSDHRNARRSHRGELIALDPAGMTPVIDRIKRAQGRWPACCG